ncbi:hypothetical protein [Alienimonas californiensis]|uniref:Uncharacterized protein n=1 Tax=Alienimonas californiensis TaxID=2527989 RepID=A0A517P6Q3_9PLAN|nr:hypothetical protein [Alienimonas californiensis]QDT15043.1 hypothetical protein CA12_11230 [Alienimonas californiensis]
MAISTALLTLASLGTLQLPIEDAGLGANHPAEALAAAESLAPKPGRTAATSGRSGDFLWAVAVRSLPASGGPLAKAAAVRTVHARVAAELLAGETLARAFAAENLTDRAALRSAALSVSGRIETTGFARETLHQTTVQDDRVVGLITADADAVLAAVRRPPVLPLMRTAYGEALARWLAAAADAGEWEKGLRIRDHLRTLDLSGPGAEVDAVRCLLAAGRIDDALAAGRMLLGRVDADSASLERLGDALLADKQPDADDLAGEAFTLASERLQTTRTDGRPHPEPPAVRILSSSPVDENSRP